MRSSRILFGNWILRSALTPPKTICVFCRHRRTLHASALNAANQGSSARSSTALAQKSSEPTSGTKPSSSADADPVPKPLTRPLGVPSPPKEGENSGIDPRPWRQRRDDFFNYDKHLERRKQLFVSTLSIGRNLPLTALKSTTTISKPYFRDWTSMRHSKGKSFLSPKTLIRAASALYFPNLQGITLLTDPPSSLMDTTPTIEGRVSILSLYSSTWAERQAATFTSPAQNPALHDLLGSLPSSTNRPTHPEAPSRSPQLVSLNVEPNNFKALLIRLFLGSLRRQTPPDRWDKYFIVRRGFSEELMAALGVANSKVGYVYLVDGECRVRWAGSGNAEEAEKDALVKGVRKLLVEEAEERRRRVDDEKKAKIQEVLQAEEEQNDRKATTNPPAAVAAVAS
ncbi:MAG: Mitochondrial ATPase complex subunit atp10 [Sclerophora amabilis]|nr:MAG: Mitochondrial ATPase complex subunit atp10 [Sclerophora amabilis]